MTQPTIEPTKFVEYWNFSSWQYVCRNEEYSKAHKKLSEYTPQENKDGYYEVDPEHSDFLVECEEKFGCPPIKGPEENRDSDLILEGALSEVLDRSIVGFGRSVYDHDTIWGLDDPRFFRYTVDIEKPLEDVLAEVEHWYTVIKSSRVADQSSPKGRNAHNKVYKKSQAKLIKHFTDRGKYRFRVDDTPRAIGLWIWDHIQKEQGSIRDASRALNSSFQLKEYELRNDIGEEASFKRLSRFYNTTKQCIYEMDVLPISP